MPIFFQQEIDINTRLAIWKIEEKESFFSVPLHRDITHPHKRLQHLAGRYLLRYLFPQFPLDLVKIADTRKPYLDDEAYHFSLSHCGDYAAAIVSRNKRVGIDIEVPTPKVERIKHKFLHKEEVGLFKTSPDTNNFTDTNENQNLTIAWSAKEAVFKWWSYGAVDFSEMIRLYPFAVQKEGMITTRFIAPEMSYDLQLHYRLFNNLCLAWVTD